MPINQKDVELLIRARNLSSQPLKEVVDSVKKVSAALDEQIAAAKRGDISAAELASTLKQLKDSEDALVKQSALIDRYRTLAQQLEVAQGNAEKAKAALANFSDTSAKSAENVAKLDGALSKAEQKAKSAAERLVNLKREIGDTTPTDKQTVQLAKLTAAYEKAALAAQQYLEKASGRAQTAMENRGRTLSDQGVRLSSIGVTPTQEGLDTAAQSIYGGVGQTSAGIKAVEDAQLGLAAARREAAQQAATEAAASREAAEAEKQQTAASRDAAKAEAEAEAEHQAALARSTAAREREGAEERAFAEQQKANLKSFREAEYAALFDQQDAAKAQAARDRETAAMERQNGVRERLTQFLNTERGARIQEAEAERKATEATKQNTEAAKQNNAAREKARSSLNLFNNDSRESLSLYQRIRGQVLAIGAAYIGLQGAIDLARGALEAMVDKQAAENRLAIVVGNDPKKIADEYAYVHDQAVRLGLGIKEMADSYSNFAIAAKNGNLSLEQTRYAFERITEVMRVNHASSDAVTGAFTQLEQMLSKNKVQMDDLRQASSWIPGLEAMMARGLANQGFSGFDKLAGTLKEMTTAKPEQRVAILFKAMKEGAVDAKTAILALAEEMDRDYKDRLPDALKSLQAEQGRLNTAFFDFKLAIANSGFADAATRLFQRLAQAMKGEEGAHFAQEISAAFSKLADLTIFLVDHLDDLIAVLKLLIELKALQWSLSLASGLKTATEAMIAMSGKAFAATEGMRSMRLSLEGAATGAGVLNKALFAIRATLMVVGAAITGWQIGTWLSEKFTTVRLAGIALTSGLMDLWTNIKFGVQIGIDGFVNAIAIALDAVETKIENITVSMAKLNPLVGAATAQKMQDQASQNQAQRRAEIDQRAKHLAAMADARAKELAQRHDTFTEQWGYEAAGGDKGAAARAAAADAAKPPEATSSPGEFGNTGLGIGEKDKTASERASMEQALANQLRSIDAKIERQQNDSLAARLKAVDDTYQAIYDKLAKFQKIGGKSVLVTDENGKDRTLTIQQYKEQLKVQTELLKVQETEKFNKQQIATLEDTFNKLLGERKAKIQAILDQLKSGGITPEQAYSLMSGVFDQMNPQIQAAADKARQVAQSAIGKGITSAQAGALGAKLDNGTAFSSDERTQDLALLADGESHINDLIRQRKDIIDANNNLVNLGLMTQKEAQDQLEKLNAELGPQIEKQADALLATLNKLHDSGKITDADFDLWTAKLKAAKSQATQLSAAMTEAKKIVTEGLQQGATTAFEGIAKGIAGVVMQTKSWGEAWRDLRVAMLQWFADFLMKIAQAIIQQQILNAIQSAGKSGGGGWVGALVTAVGTAMESHSGSVVGSGNGVSRGASASWFTNAPRYHSGGLPGLAPDEQAAILQRGEEVLSKHDPRNVLNGGKGGKGAAASPQNIKIVNAIDAHSVLDQALSTSSGQKLIMNTLFANRSQLKNLVNS